tara:strand:- start:6 stop:536 length:531 start_codon:yes stop_codon:yes gene_type:complete
MRAGKGSRNMGVTAKLYMPLLDAETIATAWLTVSGVDLGEDIDPYTGAKYIQQELASLGPSYFQIKHPTLPGLFAGLHLPSKTEPGALWPGTWVLSRPSRPDVIAGFEAIAEAFGGFLMWADTDQIGRMYQTPPGGLSWDRTCEILNSLPIAVVTDKQRARASYSESGERKRITRQ